MKCTVGYAERPMLLASDRTPRQALHLFALARTNELHLLAERSAAPIVRAAPARRPRWLSRLLRITTPV